MDNLDDIDKFSETLNHEDIEICDLRLNHKEIHDLRLNHKDIQK